MRTQLLDLSRSCVEVSGTLDENQCMSSMLESLVNEEGILHWNDLISPTMNGDHLRLAMSSQSPHTFLHGNASSSLNSGCSDHILSLLGLSDSYTSIMKLLQLLTVEVLGDASAHNISTAHIDRERNITV